MPSRNKVVFGAVTLVFLSLAGSAIVGTLAWNQLHESADRLVAIGDAMAAATLLLSALAATIALAAYLASTESPHLEVDIIFRCSEPNQPVFLAERELLSRKLRLVPFRQVDGSIRIHNRRPASAHNPALRIDLIGLGGIRPQPHWRPVDWANPYGVCAVQWDGGSQFAIHGRGTRVLPALSLDGVVAMPGESTCAMRVTAVADGFTKASTIPIELKSAEEYLDYSVERAARHLGSLTLVEQCGVEDCERQAATRLLLFPTNAGPTDVAACQDCIDNHELFQSTPALMIVDNLDLKHGHHDADGHHMVAQATRM
jgi:hypothetical protein